ncbi:TPA: BrnT family toxin [Vibrio harveyi]|nr:BrnT family toxin [Vibrio harveyi]
MSIFPKLTDECASCIDNICESDLKKLKISKTRTELLGKILKDEEKTDWQTKLDIQLYVLKRLFKEQYMNLPDEVRFHKYSTSYIRTYDPAKNGENIIKHGVSFKEIDTSSAVDNSSGIVVVEGLKVEGEERCLKFSSIFYNNLKFPLDSLKGNYKCYLLSVYTLKDNSVTRYMSSRAFCINEYNIESTIEMFGRLLKGICFKSEKEKDDFIEICLARIRENI